MNLQKTSSRRNLKNGCLPTFHEGTFGSSKSHRFPFQAPSLTSEIRTTSAISWWICWQMAFVILETMPWTIKPTLQLIGPQSRTKKYTDTFWWILWTNICKNTSISLSHAGPSGAYLIYLFKKQIQFLAYKATPYPSSLCFYRRDVTGYVDEGIHAHAQVGINENANLHEYACTVYMAGFLFV